MTTPNDLEKLKEAMRAASAAERPDPAERAAGLERLLAAEAAAPVSSRGRNARRAGLVLALALLAAWWFSRGESAVEPPTFVDQGIVRLPPPTPIPTPVLEPDAAVEAPTVEQVIVVDAGPVTKASPKPRVTEEDPDLLARELLLLDQARQQLHSASAGDALSTLETYDREFPRGSLRVEAALVRVEVLVKLGRVDEAKKVAAKLVANDRDGLVTRRAARILEAP
jgi:hypothetical protein